MQTDGEEDKSSTAIHDLLLLLDWVTGEIRSGSAPGLSMVREIYLAVGRLMEAPAQHGYRLTITA